MQKLTNPTSLFQLIPDQTFDRLIKKWHIDKKVTSLSTRKQFKIMAMSYILGIKTLRDIELTFGIARSTFGDACQNRSSGFFEDLCKELLFMMQQLCKKPEDKAAIKELLAIDSTTCQLPSLLGRIFGWRSQSNKNRGEVKLHIVWNVRKEWIDDFKISGGTESDLTVAKKLKIRSGCTYVMDRAYVDLDFWLRIEEAGSHFVTRLKKAAKQVKLMERVLKNSGTKEGVLYDGEWHPSATACLRTDFPPKVLLYRQIIYKDPVTKKVLHFITSDFETDAQEIANIYKRRWSIELLFKWLKGHMQIRRFTSKSKNAVRSWIAVSLCVHLLLSLKKLKDNLDKTLWQLLRETKTAVLLDSSIVWAFRAATSPPGASASLLEGQEG